MSPTMTMNKAIHGAVRRDLRRFAEATAAFADGDKARAAGLGRAWDNFEDQLTHHHEGEHEIAWPACLAIGVSQEVLDGFDAEHETMAAALAEAGTKMGRFRTSATAEDATTLHQAILDLRSVTEIHLDHEEAAVEELMLSNGQNPVLQEMGKKFGKVSPARGGRFFAWVLDGATPEERSAIEFFVPGPVLAIIGGIFGWGYRRTVAPVWQA